MQECKLALGEMHQQYDKLEKASTAMWDAYGIACENSHTCNDHTTHSQGSIAINFRELRAHDHYHALRNACTALSRPESPTTLCKVDTKMSLENGQFPYTVRKEPICFPYQCREDQIDVLDTYPMGCNAQSENCGVVSQIAFCGERPAGAGTGNCQHYANTISLDRNYTQAKVRLSQESQKHCEGVTDANPGDNPICTYEKASVDVVVAENFRPFEKDLTFSNYMDSCYDSNGEICFLSMNVRLSGTLFYNMDISGDYNDIPGCFPLSCGHKDREQVMRASLGTGIANKITAAMKEPNNGGGRRQLYAVEHAIAHHVAKRVLKQQETCTMGMDTCETHVVDFYCTGKDGNEIPVDENGDRAPGAASGAWRFTLRNTLVTMVSVLIVLLV